MMLEPCGLGGIALLHWVTLVVCFVRLKLAASTCRTFNALCSSLHSALG